MTHTTQDYRDHSRHFGDERWEILHCWNLYVEEGGYTEPTRYTGDEYATRDEAKRSAVESWDQMEAAEPGDYHVEIRRVIWDDASFNDRTYGRVLDADRVTDYDESNWRHDVYLWAKDDEWETA